jgi:Domain of unknown function (DUF6456)
VVTIVVHIQRPLEKLAQVRINNGQHAADLVRECDPSGAIVEHRVRKSGYVHERLHAGKKLADELYDAAEKFRMDFERAQLAGNYARLDLHKTRAGKGEMSDKVAVAKMRVSKVLDDLGNGRDGASFSQSCVWNVVGLGMTMEDWTLLIRQGGGHMNADRASGVLLGCLERLALAYGIADMGRLAALRQDGAYGRAIRDFMEFADVFGATAAGSEKSAIGKFLAAAHKRFATFA